MKSRERVEKERDKLKNIYAMILACTVLLLLIALLWMGVSEHSLDLVLVKVGKVVSDIWNDISFKFEQFFGFLFV